MISISIPSFRPRRFLLWSAQVCQSLLIPASFLIQTLPFTRGYGCLTYALMHPSISPLYSTRSSFLYADPTPNALQVFLPSTVPASSHLSALPNSVAPPINLPIEQGTFILASSTPVCVFSHDPGEPTDPANRCPARDLDLGLPDKRPVQVDVAQSYPSE